MKRISVIDTRPNNSVSFSSTETVASAYYTKADSLPRTQTTSFSADGLSRTMNVLISDEMFQEYLNLLDTYKTTLDAEQVYRQANNITQIFNISNE